MKYLFLLFMIISCARLTPSFKRFDQKYSSLAKEHSPGFQILVMKDGAVIKEGYYGLKNIETGEKITSDTVFRIASNTKAFVAYLALMLEEQGKINTQDSLKKYFPEHKILADIKIIDLIQHTSGLHDYDILCDHSETTTDKVTNEKVMDWLKNVRELKFSPGTKNLYNNTNYIVLAEVLKKVTNKDFDPLVKENIFKPLGMKNSYVSLPPQSKVAMGYRFEGKFMREHRDSCNFTFGDDGIFTNINDYKKWLNFIAQKETVFTRARFDYAFGWGIMKTPFGTAYAHSGKWTGFRAHARYYPADRLWIAFLSNNRDINMDEIVEEANSAAREEF